MMGNHVSCLPRLKIQCHTLLLWRSNSLIPSIDQIDDQFDHGCFIGYIVFPLSSAWWLQQHCRQSPLSCLCNKFSASRDPTGPELSTRMHNQWWRPDCNIALDGLSRRRRYVQILHELSLLPVHLPWTTPPYIHCRSSVGAFSFCPIVFLSPLKDVL